MSKTNKYRDPLSIGVGIAQQDLQNQVGIKNEHDDDADLFASLGAMAGPQPRGAAALFSGLAKGAEYGSRSKSTAKKQEALSKYDRVMDYFRTQNMEMEKQKKWYETRDFAKTKYLPQVLSYAQNVNNLDPQSRRMMLDDILNGYNQTIGEDYKLSSIDGSNPFIVTLTGKKGAQVVDIRNLFSGDENAQAMLNMQMPEYLKQQQEERQDKERKFQLEEDRLALMRESMPEKNAIQREKLEQTRRRNDQSAMKSDIKLSETLGKKIDSSREFLTIVPKIEKIVKDHPDIFQSAIDATWRETGNPGYADNFIKDMQNKWNPDKVAALTSMIKYINKMTLDVANGFARPNMFIEKIGSKAVPNLDMNPQGFLKVLEEMKQENQTSIKNNQARFDLLKSDLDSGLSEQYRESTNGVMGMGQGSSTPVQTTNQAPTSKDMSGNVVTIFDPDTGETTQIDQAYLDSAIAGGWEQVQNG